MLHIPTLEEIKQRAKRAGVSLGVLADRAGVDQSIIYRAARGEGRTGFDGVRLVHEQLVQAEQECLEYFLRLFNAPPELARDLIAKRGQGQLPLPPARAKAAHDEPELARLEDDGGRA